MPTNRYEGNLLVDGDLIVTGDFNPPAACIDDDAIEAAAEIDHTKLEHRRNITWSQDIEDDATTQAVVIYLCYPAGGATLLAFSAGCVTVAGAATTVSIDLKKNGTTVLSAPVVLDNGNTAYIPEDGTLSVTALAQDDVLSVHLTLSGANEPKGCFINVILKEKGV